MTNRRRWYLRLMSGKDFESTKSSWENLTIDNRLQEFGEGLSAEFFSGLVEEIEGQS